MSDDEYIPTARELAARGERPQSFGRTPAVVCPHCGCAMFTYKTTTLKTRIERYERCRNASCGKRFVTYQAPAPPVEIVREIE
jgi:hypothetical protein